MMLIWHRRGKTQCRFLGDMKIKTRIQVFENDFVAMLLKENDLLWCAYDL